MLALEEKVKTLYEEAEQHWKRVAEQGFTSNPEVRELTETEATCMVTELHKTRKRISVEMTRMLLELLYQNKVMTAQQFYEDYGWNNRPLLHRLKVFRKYRLIRRVSNKYYIATPRLCKFVENQKMLNKLLPLDNLN